MGLGISFGQVRPCRSASANYFCSPLVRCVDLARNLRNILGIFILDMFTLVIFIIDIFILVIFIDVGYDFILVIFIFVMSALSLHCSLALRLL